MVYFPVTQKMLCILEMIPMTLISGGAMAKGIGSVFPAIPWDTQMWTLPCAMIALCIIMQAQKKGISEE